MSFQTKLFLVFAPFFIIVSWLMLFFTIQFEHLIIRQFESDIQDIVHTVHYSTQKLAARKGPDTEALEKFIEEVKSNTSVREVSVVGSSQKIVASSNPKKVGQRATCFPERRLSSRRNTAQKIPPEGSAGRNEEQSKRDWARVLFTMEARRRRKLCSARQAICLPMIPVFILVSERKPRPILRWCGRGEPSRSTLPRPPTV